MEPEALEPSVLGKRPVPSAQEEEHDALQRTVWVGRVPQLLEAAEAERVLTDLVAERCGLEADASSVSVACFGPHRERSRRERKYKHRGFALVRFPSAAAATAAAAALDGSVPFLGPDRPTAGTLVARTPPDLKYPCAPPPAEEEAPTAAAPEPPELAALRAELPAVAEALGDDEATRAACAPFSVGELASLAPMRKTCLCTNTMLDDLAPVARARVWRYLRGQVIPTAPELARLVFAVAERHPTLVRVKELVETCEAFRLLVTVLEAVRHSGRAVDTLLDVACGHGLCAVLLAYRFPRRKVIAVDLQKRPAFDAWVTVFAELGSRAYVPDGGAPMQNLEFREGDLSAVEPLVSARSAVVALHGCNDSTKRIVSMAVEAGAVWAAMPCCIPTHIYLPGCSLAHVDDGTRYALMCGAVAATYGAQFVRGIESVITNRALFLAGGCGDSAALRFNQATGPFALPRDHHSSKRR